MRRATAAMQEAVDALRPHRAEPLLTSQLDVLADEHENLRQVIVNRLEADPEAALALSIGAAEFWAVRGLGGEGRGHVLASIDAAEATGERRWDALSALARMTRTMADTASLRPELEAALVEMRGHDVDRLLLASILMYLAIARGWQGDRAGAVVVLDEVEVINRDLGTPGRRLIWSTFAGSMMR